MFSWLGLEILAKFDPLKEWVSCTWAMENGTLRWDSMLESIRKRKSSLEISISAWVEKSLQVSRVLERGTLKSGLGNPLLN